MSHCCRLGRWSAAALTCLLVGTPLAVPERLPQPVQLTVDVAIDRAASFWLWVMNQPREPVALQRLSNSIPA